MRSLLLLFFTLSGFSVFGQDLIFDSSNLNSYADEQFPVLSPDGLTIFFTRAHHEGNVAGKKDKGDVYMSQLTDSIGWTTPVRLTEINNDYYNSVLDLSGQSLLLYGEYRTSNSPSPGVSLTEASNWPQGWSSPSALNIEYFKNTSANLSASLSSDGNIMILSIESYKNHGAEDIYVSFWDDTKKEWSEPKNLGPVVNTSLQELTPFLAADNKTLFFASNGHEGYGSRDIFVTQRIDDTWTNWTVPENLGILVNTEGAEMGYRIYPDMELALYSSTSDSDGYGDIKIIPVSEDDVMLLEPLDMVVPEDVVEVDVITTEDPEAVVVEEGEVLLTGNIIDINTGEMVFARVKLLEEEDVTEHYNDSTYSFSLLPDATYIIQVDAEGYISKSFTLDVFNEAQTEDIYMEPIAIGTTVKLDHVLFVRGTTDLVESSYEELDLVVDMMTHNPTMEIELSGHTDNVGVASLNERLSQERVDSVIEYLAEQGIDKSRLSGKGYGGSKPVASNANESTRRLNRRVEFTIIHQ